VEIAGSDKFAALVLPLGFAGETGGRGGLLELHHGGLDVLTPRTFEGTTIEVRFLQLTPRQIHLRRALRARWAGIDRRVFKRVFGNGHLRLLQLQAGAHELSGHRRVIEIGVDAATVRLAKGQN
jgi:hypothetical protein